MSLLSNIEISRNGPVEPHEIEALREAVGWDRCEGIYATILQRHYAYYTVRMNGTDLVGYMSVLSDGVADAFLLDLMIHPQVQGKGIGEHLVKHAIRDLKHDGIRCIQVTFDQDTKRFYEKCGFHIFGGGIIDLKYMPAPEIE